MALALAALMYSTPNNDYDDIEPEANNFDNTCKYTMMTDSSTTMYNNDLTDPYKQTLQKQSGKNKALRTEGNNNNLTEVTQNRYTYKAHAEATHTRHTSNDIPEGTHTRHAYKTISEETTTSHRQDRQTLQQRQHTERLYQIEGKGMGDETQGDLLEGIHDSYAYSDQATPTRASKRTRDTTEGTGNIPRQHSQSNNTTGPTKANKQTQHTDTQGVQTRSCTRKRQRIHDQGTRQALSPIEHGMQTRSRSTLQDFYQPIARQQQNNNQVVAPVQGTGKRTISSRQTTIRQYVQTEVDAGQQPQQALSEDSDSDINSESTAESEEHMETSERTNPLMDYDYYIWRTTELQTELEASPGGRRTGQGYLANGNKVPILTKTIFATLADRNRFNLFRNLGMTGHTMSDIRLHYLPADAMTTDYTPPNKEEMQTIKGVLKIILRHTVLQRKVNTEYKNLKKNLAETTSKYKRAKRLNTLTETGEATYLHSITLIEAAIMRKTVVQRDIQKTINQATKARLKLYAAYIPVSKRRVTNALVTKLQVHESHLMEQVYNVGLTETQTLEYYTPVLTKRITKRLKNVRQRTTPPEARAERAVEVAATPTTRRPTKQEARTAIMGEDRLWDLMGTWTECTGHNSELRVSTINIAGLDKAKAELIGIMMKKFDIDVMMCIDAQTTKRTGEYIAKDFKDALGPGTQTHTSTYAGSVKTGNKGAQYAGGIFIVVGPKWGRSTIGFQDDPTGLGVTSKLILQGSTGQIQIIGTYWPIKYTTDEAGSHSLQARIGQWLKQEKRYINTDSAWKYAKHLVENWVHKHNETLGNVSVNLGDFN